MIFLAARAETGPRALGSRTIPAAATSAGMRDHLNDIKLREHFRPVAPICLEDRAPDILSPGRRILTCCLIIRLGAEWLDKVPAVVHLDGSARLQTIGRVSQHQVSELLVEYEKLTGIPLLCNTRVPTSMDVDSLRMSQQLASGGGLIISGAMACF